MWWVRVLVISLRIPLSLPPVRKESVSHMVVTKTQKESVVFGGIGKKEEKE